MEADRDQVAVSRAAACQQNNPRLRWRPARCVSTRQFSASQHGITHMSNLGYREVFALVLEQLATAKDGSYHQLADAVVGAARAKNLIDTAHSQTGWSVNGRSTTPDAERVRELVREAMWECLIKRLLIFGLNDANPEWPFYRLTSQGKELVKAGHPQPYDPDGFVAYFRRNVSGIDPTVDGYFAEAVQAFNSGCNRAAAVMLGCASEKLLLLLCDAFEAAIADPAKLAAFKRDLGRKWAISHKYAILRERLDLMADGKKLPYDHTETVGSELPSGYEMLRRCRNAAGHPDVPGDVEVDTIFLNLRSFVEYAKRVTALITYFGTNPADW